MEPFLIWSRSLLSLDRGREVPVQKPARSSSFSVPRSLFFLFPFLTEKSPQVRPPEISAVDQGILALEAGSPAFSLRKTLGRGMFRPALGRDVSWRRGYWARIFLEVFPSPPILIFHCVFLLILSLRSSDRDRTRFLFHKMSTLGTGRSSLLPSFFSLFIFFFGFFPSRTVGEIFVRTRSPPPPTPLPPPPSFPPPRSPGRPRPRCSHLGPIPSPSVSLRFLSAIFREGRLVRSPSTL